MIRSKLLYISDTTRPAIGEHHVDRTDGTRWRVTKVREVASSFYVYGKPVRS